MLYWFLRIKQARFIIPAHLIVLIWGIRKWSKTYCHDKNKKWRRFCILFLIGIIYSNFFEYFTHRILFHSLPLIIGRNAYYVAHGHHHKYPNGISFIPLPQMILIYMLTWKMFSYMAALRDAANLLIGGSVGFLTFELSHWYIHALGSSPHAYLRAMVDFHKAHHLNHHVAYTFTSTFWDWLFGTLPDTFLHNVIPLPLPILPFLFAWKKE